jgi:hypothetical protein
MSSSPEMPLHLFQVLEEEYVSLHRPLSIDSLTVQLPDEENENRWRDVTARFDWSFHEGHVKDPFAFAASLLSVPDSKDAKAKKRSPRTSRTIAQEAQSYDWAKWNLKRYLRQKISDERLQGICDDQQQAKSNKAPATLLKDELNNVLRDPHLYKSDRFSNNWLGTASKSLIKSNASEPFQGDDLAHFNRLLLEDAFPESLEKIHNIRLAAIYQLLHAVKQKALCLSGGGIRSGTFALGLFQGMARHKLLAEFDYLSTVSGGGYIGSWLTAWIHRHRDGLEGVTRELSGSATTEKIDPDPEPLRNLRKYSNFITPKVGLLTADTWTFVGIYLRNLFLNWLVIVPLLIGVLLFPRLLLALTLSQPDQTHRGPLIDLKQLGLEYGIHMRHVFLFFGFSCGVWALSYVIFNRPGLRESLEACRPFWRDKIDQKWFLRLCLLPLIISAFCLTTYWAWSREVHEGMNKSIWVFFLFGLIFTFFAWLIASVILKRAPSVKELPEGIALIIAGVLGGAFFWALARSPFGFPVASPFWARDWAATSLLKWKTEWYVSFAVPGFLLVFLLAATAFVGLISYSNTIEDDDREWWSRFGAWVLIVIIVWSVFNPLVIFGPIALLWWPKILTSLGGISGLVATLVGRSSKTPATAQKTEGGFVASLAGRSLPLLALIFTAFLLVVISLGTTGLIQGLAKLAHRIIGNDKLISNASDLRVFPNFTADAIKLAHLNVAHHTRVGFVLLLLIVMFASGRVLAKFINLNVFSLHGGYRNRLIRAFLGASRPDHERKPNPFTGFDPLDNLHMHELRSFLLNEDDFLRPELIAEALKQALDKSDSPDRDKRGNASAGLRIAISSYLVQNGRLSSARDDLKAYDVNSPASQRLIAALRTDLNRVIEQDSLYSQDFVRNSPQTKRVIKAQYAIKSSGGSETLNKEDLRSDYHLLLNRLILEEAYPGAIRPVQHPPYRMLHVINTTLNLVGGSNLAWQQRKAEPFSVTPLHAGCFRLGYRRSRDYGGRETGGISLGTAAAISGAAASSNMGYYTTSPVLSLLLTLFNVRLGWWLGNPGPAGDKTYALRAPKNSVRPIIDEALGLTNDGNKYVYLTDGGHFENLALYEMVLRRCHVIVVSDGSQDERYRFTDLGNAVRKIRIDLGVPIEFTSVPIYAELPSKEKGRGMYWAVGRIRYDCIDGPNVKDGVLLYIKPAVYGLEPPDLLEYKKSYPAFPHQSTADQFFDEPQFESYRALGSHIMDQLCGEQGNELDLYAVLARAFHQLTEKADGTEAADPQLKDWLAEWLKNNKTT